MRCLFLPLLLAARLPAAIIIIDDFTGPSTSLTSTGRWVYADVPALPSSSVLGGHRRIGLSSISGGLANAHVSPAEGAVLDSVTEWGYLNLSYGTQSPLDLNVLASGNTTLVVDIQYQLNGARFLPLGIKIASGSNEQTDSRYLFPDQEGRSSVSFPLPPRFDPLLSDVDLIEIYFYRVDPRTTMSILGITLIPEPSTPLLSSLALTFLLARRSRSVLS